MLRVILELRAVTPDGTVDFSLDVYTLKRLNAALFGGSDPPPLSRPTSREARELVDAVKQDLGDG